MPEKLRNMLRLDVSLGNLVTIATVIIGLTTGWTQLRADQKSMNDRLVELEESDAKRQDRDYNTAQVLAEIRADLKYLRITVERQVGNRER